MKTSYSELPKQEADWGRAVAKMLVICIQKVPGSNHSPLTGYIDSSFCEFPPQSLMLNIITVLWHSYLLPNSYLHTIYNNLPIPFTSTQSMQLKQWY